MQSYLAMVRAQEAHGFFIDYPDLPGCSGSVLKFPDVQALARALLSHHLRELQAQGMPLPEPRSMKEMFDSGLADGAIPILVPAPHMDDELFGLASRS